MRVWTQLWDQAEKLLACGSCEPLDRLRYSRTSSKIKNSHETALFAKLVPSKSEIPGIVDKYSTVVCSCLWRQLFGFRQVNTKLSRHERTCRMRSPRGARRFFCSWGSFWSFWKVERSHGIFLFFTKIGRGGDSMQAQGITHCLKEEWHIVFHVEISWIYLVNFQCRFHVMPVEHLYVPRGSSITIPFV